MHDPRALLQGDARRGDDLRHQPIERRKAALAKLIQRANTDLVLNEHIDEPGS